MGVGVVVVKKNDRVNAVWCTGAKMLQMSAFGFQGFTAASPICGLGGLSIYPSHSSYHIQTGLVRWARVRKSTVRSR